jgi:hypothetical protein
MSHHYEEGKRTVRLANLANACSEMLASIQNVAGERTDGLRVALKYRRRINHSEIRRGCDVGAMRMPTETNPHLRFIGKI